jgi:hypothetical protein
MSGMWRRKPALKLLVAHPGTQRRRGRFRGIGAGSWIPGKLSPARARRSKHAERPLDAAPQDGLTPATAPLEQDSTAFVEALEVPTSIIAQPRRRRDAARARLELVRLVAEADALAHDLYALKGALAVGDYSRLAVPRRPRSGWGPAALKEEIETAQQHLARKQEEVEAKRIWTEALEREAREPPRSGESATTYRLHSADHYVNCSSGQYEHLSGVQRTIPVLLTAKNGWHWWWYRDRFWWADRRMSAREIESTILTIDLASESQREAFERAQAGLVGRNDGVSASADVVPEDVRREVWIRDRGRCVDCGVASSLAFDHVLPVAVGGSNTAPNLELRCRPCQARRRANEARATVGKARIGAQAAKEWGVEVKDISWPRPPDEGGADVHGTD